GGVDEAHRAVAEQQVDAVGVAAVGAGGDAAGRVHAGAVAGRGDVEGDRRRGVAVQPRGADVGGALVGGGGGVDGAALGECLVGVGGVGLRPEGVVGGGDAVAEVALHVLAEGGGVAQAVGDLAEARLAVEVERAVGGGEAEVGVGRVGRRQA